MPTNNRKTLFRVDRRRRLLNTMPNNLQNTLQLFLLLLLQLIPILTFIHINYTVNNLKVTPNTQRPQYNSQWNILRDGFDSAVNSWCAFIILNNELKHSRQCCYTLGHWTNLRNPWCRLLLRLKGIDEIKRHSLLPHYSLLRSSHNKIPSLIVFTLSGLYLLLDVQLAQSAPIGSHHNGDLPKRYLLYLSFYVNSLLLHAVHCHIVELTINEVKLKLSLIRQISKSAHHGGNLLHLFIQIPVMCCCFINGLIELKLPEGILLHLVIQSKLMADRDCEVTIILNDLSKVAGEAIIRLYLLTNKTTLFKITVKHLPHVLLSDNWVLAWFHYL